MASRRVIQRRVVVFLLLLGGGAIVNVAVAWGCACWTVTPYPQQKRVPFVPEGIPPDVLKFIPQSWMVPPNGAVVFAAVNRADGTGYSYTQILFNYEYPGADRFLVFDRLLHVQQAGWPTSTFENVGEMNPSTPIRWGATATVIWNNAFDPPQFLHARSTHGLIVGSYQRAIPCKPLWLGFAFNTIFYIASLWILLNVPGQVQRTLRRRRGLCPACAYPIGASPVCTECGTAVNVRTTA